MSGFTQKDLGPDIAKDFTGRETKEAAEPLLLKASSSKVEGGEYDRQQEQEQSKDAVGDMQFNAYVTGASSQMRGSVKERTGGHRPEFDSLIEKADSQVHPTPKHLRKLLDESQKVVFNPTGEESTQLSFKGGRINNNKEPKNPKFANMSRVLHVSLGFFFLFLGVNATQVITLHAIDSRTGIFADKTFRDSLLGLLCLFICLGSIFGSYAFKKLGNKASFAFATCSYLALIIAFSLPMKRDEICEAAAEIFLLKEGFMKATLLVAISVNGLGVSLLWVSIGDYLARCAVVENKGYFFGMFWSIDQASLIFAYYSVALIYSSSFTTFSFYLLMSSLTVIALVVFCCLRKPYITKLHRHEAVELGRESEYFTQVDSQSQVPLDESSGGSSSQTAILAGQNAKFRLTEKLQQMQQAQGTQLQLGDSLPRLVQIQEGTMIDLNSGHFRASSSGTLAMLQQDGAPLASSETSFQVVRTPQQRRKVRKMISSTDVLASATKPGRKTSTPLTVSNEIKNFFSLVFSGKMLLLTPLIFWTGGALAYSAGILIPIMREQQLQDHAKQGGDIPKEEDLMAAASYALILLGLGHCIFGVFMGKLLDRTSMKVGCLASGFVVLITAVLSWLTVEKMSFDYLTYWCLFFWGASQAMVNTLAFTILGFEFTAKALPFTAFTFVQGLAVACFVSVQEVIKEGDNSLFAANIQVYTICIGAIGILGLLCTYFFKFEKAKKEMKEKDVDSNMTNSDQSVKGIVEEFEEASEEEKKTPAVYRQQQQIVSAFIDTLTDQQEKTPQVSHSPPLSRGREPSISREFGTEANLEKGPVQAEPHLVSSSPQDKQLLNTDDFPFPNKAARHRSFGKNIPRISFAAAQQNQITSSPQSSGGVSSLLEKRKKFGIVRVSTVGSAHDDLESPTQFHEASLSPVRIDG